MTYEELVKYIKKDGCRVVLLNRKHVDESGATFQVTERGPIIHLAGLGDAKDKRVSTLLHEYGHYLQWKEGWAPYVDEIVDIWDTWDRWITGKIELTDTEKSIIRNMMLFIEWDAELRQFALGKQLGAKNFSPAKSLRWAISYMIGIKWSWKHRKTWVKNIPERNIKNAFVWGPKKLFAPLTEAENELTKKSLPRL